MSVTRAIINWCDKKYEEAVDEGNGTKAFVAGVVEGFVDGSVLFYVPACIALYVTGRISSKNK